MQSGKAVWPWIVGVVVIGGAGAWLFRDSFSSGGAAPAAVQAPAPATATAGPPAAAPPSPAAAPVQHPLDADAAADPALPPLADSDATAWNALATLFPGEGVLAPVMREFLIQRLVTHIDNLDKPSVPPTALALRPLPGELQVAAGADGSSQLAAANAARYAPYVKAFTGADAGAVGQAYVRFYPLVQKAYASLGRPDAYFNDRLVQVIDHLLDTPEPARPLAVERDERGRYRFVDPALQSRSVGQKALLRLDLQQERAVKQQLRAIRSAVTRG